jgi:hypothetical protein
VARNQISSGLALTDEEIQALKDHGDVNICFQGWPKEDAILSRIPGSSRSFDYYLDGIVQNVNDYYKQLVDGWKSPDPATPSFSGDIENIQGWYAKGSGWRRADFGNFNAAIEKKLEEAADIVSLMASAQIEARNLVNGIFEKDEYYYGGQEVQDPVMKMEFGRKQLERALGKLAKYSEELRKCGETRGADFLDELIKNKRDEMTRTASKMFASLKVELENGVSSVEGGLVKDRTKLETIIVKTKVILKLVKEAEAYLTDSDKDWAKKMEGRIAPLEVLLIPKQGKLSKALEIVVPVIMGILVGGTLFFLYRPK